MNILILCNKMPFPPNDGGAIATINMIQGFANSGDQVTVITMLTYKHQVGLDQLPQSLYKNIRWIQIPVDTRLYLFRALINLLFSKLPYNAERFISKEYTNTLEQLLKNQQFDIVQLEGLYLSPYISSIKAYPKILISLRAHNVEHEIWNRMQQNATRWFKRFYFRVIAQRVKALEIKTLSQVDLLVPITKKDLESLPFQKRENIRVIPGGMPDSHFLSTVYTQKNSIGFIGALDWFPNQEGLIWFIETVWISLKKKFPDWSFEIAGRKAPEAFKNKLARYPVIYVGEVPNALDFIDQFQLVVVPLLSGSGMRIKIVEALSRGKCVVTTKIGAEGIEAENGKELYICHDSNEMAAILENLFRNPQIIEDCGQNALKFATKNYKNSQLINDLRTFYHQKLNESYEQP